MVNPGNELRRKRSRRRQRRACSPARSQGRRAALDARLPRPEDVRRRQRRSRRATSSASRGKNYREQYRAAAHRAPRAQQRRLRPRGRGQRAPLAAVLALVLLQRLPAVVRRRHARGRLGDGPVPRWTTTRGPSRHRRLRAAPLRRDAPLGARSRSSRRPDRPVVYVARGSHASYFEAGFHQTEAWYDLADGKRRMKHRPTLEILGDETHPRGRCWPGRWGDTLPRKTGRRVQQPDRARAPRSSGPSPTSCSTTRRRSSTHGKGAAPPDVRDHARRRPAALRVRRHQARPAPARRSS